MNLRFRGFVKVTTLIPMCLIVVGVTMALPFLKVWLRPAAAEVVPGKQDKLGTTELVGAKGSQLTGAETTLRLPADVVKSLGVQTSEAQPATPPEPLKFAGSLFLDANRLHRAHSKFAGEVIELGTVADGSQRRPIRYGDSVKERDLLAVIWSKDLGEKKSELVDAIVRHELDKGTLQRLDDLYKRGSIPERSLREQERAVEADLIALQRAERTLRSWRLTEAEINAIKNEASNIRQRKGQHDPSLERNWARVEVRAPFDATILEMNIAVGDVVDTSLDLFKIADLRKLRVLAHAYEEDLPVLQRLKPGERRWTIRLKSDADGRPLQESSFDQIGNIIDPNQHTALVMGWIDNADGRLRVGQFITATVALPAPPYEVVVAKTALNEEGQECSVFVEARPNEYTSRKVALRRRGRDVVYLASQLTEDEKRQGLEPLQPHEVVVTASVVELAAALGDLQAEAKAQLLASAASRK